MSDQRWTISHWNPEKVKWDLHPFDGSRSALNKYLKERGWSGHNVKIEAYGDPFTYPHRNTASDPYSSSK